MKLRPVLIRQRLGLIQISQAVDPVEYPRRHSTLLHRFYLFGSSEALQSPHSAEFIFWFSATNAQNALDLNYQSGGLIGAQR